jgi:rhamnogalacturonan endolyase
MANVNYGSQFYDDIAQYIPNYVTSSQRGTWTAKINLPKGASNAIAILSAPGYDYQDNTANTAAYQYWADIDGNGKVEIDRVKAGDYRLTIYADGIFGDYVYENVTVSAGKQTNSGNIKWDAESSGTELWRLGNPDKSAGEFRHGDTPDPTHPLHPPEYRIYWGAYDFIKDFPTGVHFKIGESNVAQDFNYVHWSVFGGSLNRPEVVAGPSINNWTVSFDLKDSEIKHTTNGTLTIQFAGVATDAGNTDVFSTKLPYYNLPYVVSVNGHDLPPFIVP